MDKKVYLIELYDIYECLLNDRQKEYFKSYYFDDLSFGEIAQNHNISRNAVFKNVKMVSDKLSLYEQSLKLYDKSKKLDVIIDKITDESLKKQLDEIRW